ncbi:hypothetical protein ON010_g2498 [Phytophthora cinnamomi]|nr:hypothetical protein ON010_g2498 [Phytophthora cinnamomi]
MFFAPSRSLYLRIVTPRRLPNVDTAERGARPHVDGGAVLDEVGVVVDKVKIAWGSDSDDSDWSDDEDVSKPQTPAADIVDLEALLQQRDDAMKTSAKTTKASPAPKKVEAVKESASMGKRHAFPALPIEVIDEPYEDYTAEHDYAHENKLLEQYMKQEEEEKSTDIGDLRTVISNSKKKGAATQASGSASSTGESYEKTPAEQRHLLRFQKRISRCPLQCLRYDYGGEPLWPVVIPQNLKVPNCPGCGEERSFEMQLTPTINYFLKVDEYAAAESPSQQKSVPTSDGGAAEAPKAVVPPGGMDWLSLIVYSCSASCTQNHEEFIYVKNSKHHKTKQPSFFAQHFLGATSNHLQPLVDSVDNAGDARAAPAAHGRLWAPQQLETIAPTSLRTGQCIANATRLLEERHPRIQRHGRTAQEFVPGRFSGGGGLQLEEAQDAVHQVQLPGRHARADLFVGQSPVQRVVRGGANARGSVAVDLALGVPFVAAELYDVVGAYSDGGNAAQAQGRAADPQSGQYPRVHLGQCTTEPQTADGEGFTGTAAHGGRECACVFDLNHYNIRTAIDRAGKFVATRTTRANLLAVNSIDGSSKSEAPEDDLLAVPSPALFAKWSAKPNALDTKRFWKLIDETEKLVNFGIAAFKTGGALSSLTTALMRLGVGRTSMLQPIAAQTVYMLQAESPKINAHKASMVVTAIAHLLPKESRRQDWVLEALQVTSKAVLAGLDDENTSAEDRQRATEVLVPLTRSFLFVEKFDEDLFRKMFEEVNSGTLDKLNLPPFKLRVLKSKLYQVHLDCELNDRPSEFRLSPALKDECKRVFDAHQKKGKSSSFRLHHLVSSALDEIGIRNETSFATEAGYHLDVVAPRQKIAIELNPSDCYQALEPDDDDKDPKTFAFVDLKARHLELLGWTVIQLHADRFQQLDSLEDRVLHLSMLLEIATCRERKAAAANRAQIKDRK